MKARHYLSALTLACGVISAQAAPVPIYSYPDPTTFAELYGDFYSFSLPILSSAAVGFTQSSVNFGNSSLYYINTANVIQDALVVGTGSGHTNNQDLTDQTTDPLYQATGVPQGYPFPNGDGNPTYAETGWTISLANMKQFLTVDGVVNDLVAYFNNNQKKTSPELNSLWAYAEVILSNADGSNIDTLFFRDSQNLNPNPPSVLTPDYVLSGGPVTLCFNWTDPAKTGNNDLRTEVDCSQPHTTTSVYEHNLGQNDVAYAITSLELNNIIKNWENSGFTKMTINVDFQSLNNGYENLYLGAACINCGYQVPEPGSLALLGLALAGLGFVRIRRS